MITLKSLYLGNIDAKNELLNDNDFEKEQFVNAYVIPPSLVIEKFMERDMYFILGLKGTGKTALLRYVAIKLEQNSDAYSAFILFKTEIDEDFRKDFAKAARTGLTENNAEGFEGEDFELVWRWFIYRKLVMVIKEKSISVFEKNHQLENFSSLVLSPVDSGEKSGIMKLIPTIRKGNIEISKDPKLGLEFDWDANGKAKVNFGDLVRKADERFLELTPGADKLNLFFDELELSNNTKKQFQRDSKLIRDLIVAIDRINAIAKKNGYGICSYAAIRSEVQVSVASLGKEINKVLADFGTEILWNRAGVDDENQPLLFVITERLRNALAANGLTEVSRAKIWDNFFPKTIQNNSPQRYILHHSWYRPRDVIRMLKTAQDQYPNEQTFGHQVFDAIKRKYSEASWVEITEELKAKYRSEDIGAIKRLLYGYKQVFSLGEIIQRVSEIKNLYPEIEQLIENHKIQNILIDLYRIGAIGNIDDGNLRFVFRGNDDIMLEQKCYVHNALKAFLSITKYA